MKRKAPNMRFVLEKIIAYDWKVLVFSLSEAPLRVMDQMINIVLLAEIVDLVTKHDELHTIVTIACFAATKYLIASILQYLDAELAWRGYLTKMKLTTFFAGQYMRMDFSSIESPEGKNLAQRAQNTLFRFDYRDKPPVEIYALILSSLLSSVIGVVLYGGTIAILTPWIIIAILSISAVSLLLQQMLVKYDQRDKNRYIPIERKLHYLINRSRDFKAAKDVKIYGLDNWFRVSFEKQIQKRIDLFKQRGNYQFLVNSLIAAINSLFTMCVYLYLTRQFQGNRITVSEFVLYFGMITGFNTWLLNVVNDIESLHSASLSIADLRNFCAMNEASHDCSNGDCQLIDNSICFQHVSFNYPGSEKEVLQDISFEVRPGEKIAIVGANGAGKTTLVKLLCGLYRPSTGKILIGKQDVQTIKPEERFLLFSVVFQDIYLLPASIEKNITLNSQPDKSRLDEVIRMSGLQLAITKLPQRENTVLVRGVMESAEDLSGGELQKLALARALYKNGQFLVLDEPTAALDPIAEKEMYQKYHMLCEGKTSIFISHRLSSTRFCDRIFFLENGRITESGSHKELIELGGKYAEMYSVQSRYYQEAER